MLTLYYAPGACSMASHIVLEESGEKYEPKKVDLAGGEQRTEAYLKLNPQGRVPVLRLDDGYALAENTAILPYLGKRFGLWPKAPEADAKAMSTIGFFAASVHPAHAHVGRPERYTADQSAFPGIKEAGLDRQLRGISGVDEVLELVRAFVEEWPLFLGVVLTVVAASGALGWLMSRSRALPGTTAVWGSSPGAATAM